MNHARSQAEYVLVLRGNNTIRPHDPKEGCREGALKIQPWVVRIVFLNFSTLFFQPCLKFLIVMVLVFQPPSGCINIVRFNG